MSSSKMTAEELVANPANLFNRLPAAAVLSLPPVGLPAEVIHRKTPRRGRPVGKTHTLTEQILIGVSARTDGVAKTARVFGTIPATVDGYKDGSTQQGRKDAKPHPVLKPALDAVLKKTSDMVADRILGSISAIKVKEDGTVQGLDADKPQAAASLALTLASVHEKLAPSGKGNDNRVQIVIYGPEERTEDQYESLEVPLTMEER